MNIRAIVPCLAGLTAAAMLLAVQSVHAAPTTYRVDDSATLPGESTLQMRWRSLAPGRAGDNVVEASTVLTIRLDLRPFAGRTGRIYMVLPQQPIGVVNVQWATQGRMLPGRLISGQRGLVYAGAISAAALEDTLALQVSSDGRLLSAPQRLQFHFEIDVE
jgi:hypothetical protein